MEEVQEGSALLSENGVVMIEAMRSICNERYSDDVGGE
jgi:hypothetical protein